MQRRVFIAGQRYLAILCGCLAVTGALPALGQSLASRAKEAGCVDRPESAGGALYRCKTASGVPAYFNVPGADGGAPRTGGSGKGVPAPANFPKVDADTQRTRDDLRRKVLGDELIAEEKLLAEARVLYANGAPKPLPEETANAAVYQERIARLRQAVVLHERNVEALRKELGNAR
ncbi:MAG: DUF4124 domain-containing protein [Burkholderiales bacterium]|nr:DUF4124 domain-containing protein [Burkholderiales bacterium]